MYNMEGMKKCPIDNTLKLIGCRTLIAADTLGFDPTAGTPPALAHPRSARWCIKQAVNASQDLVIQAKQVRQRQQLLQQQIKQQQQMWQKQLNNNSPPSPPPSLGYYLQHITIT
jgi:hypothetical protein